MAYSRVYRIYIYIYIYIHTGAGTLGAMSVVNWMAVTFMHLELLTSLLHGVAAAAPYWLWI